MKRLLVRVVLAAAAAAALVAPGCINPPTRTVLVQDSGQPPVLVWDRNGDGQPDMVPVTRPKLDPVTSQPVLDPVTSKPESELVLDGSGKPRLQPDVVPGSKIYAAAEAVDAVAPSVLSGVGAFVPGGIGAVLIGLGAAWRLSRFGRIFSNTVMSVQVARQRLKDNGYGEALKLLDEAISSGQLKLTIDEIRKLKDRMGLPSVTDAKSFAAEQS